MEQRCHYSIPVHGFVLQKKSMVSYQHSRVVILYGVFQSNSLFTLFFSSFFTRIQRLDTEASRPTTWTCNVQYVSSGFEEVRGTPGDKASLCIWEREQKAILCRFLLEMSDIHTLTPFPCCIYATSVHILWEPTWREEDSHKLGPFCPFDTPVHWCFPALANTRIPLQQ